MPQSVPDASADSKVSNQKPAIILEEKIFWRQITVKELDLMRIIQRWTELLKPQLHIRYLEKPSGPLLLQGSNAFARQRVHGDRRPVRLFDQIVDAQNIGMNRLTVASDGLPQFPHYLLIAEHFPRDKVQRDFFAQHFVKGQPHLCQCAFSNFPT
jgi:hypothetical protein